MKYLFAFMAILAVSAVQAQPRFVSHCGVVHHAPVHQVVEVVKVREVLIPVAVPFVAHQQFGTLYLGGNSYTFPGAQQFAPQVMPAQQPVQPMAQMPVQAKPSISNDQLDSLLDALERRLAERNKKPLDLPPMLKTVSFVQDQEEKEENYAEVLFTHCAECHSAGKLKANDFALFVNGQLAPGWNPQAVWDAIATDRMPPQNRSRVPAKSKSIIARAFKVS